jgi:PAS domain S-box-containing protein
MTIPQLLSLADADDFTRDLLAKIGETTPNLIYAKDLKSRMIFANRAVLGVLGKSWHDIRGKSDEEWHDDPEEGRRFVEADARVMASGATEESEEVLTGVGGTRVYLSTKSPLRSPDGTVIGLVGISKDITQRKNEERWRELVLSELDHRVKNSLAIIQAMARQTFKHEGIDGAVWNAFEGRITSMAKAHDLLIEQSWVGADIAQIVAEGLEAHGGGQAAGFSLSGPAAWVDAQTALALSMALHELGTNAIKYGALSVPDGRVSISWQIVPSADAPMLDLVWREHGGLPVTKPSHRGFGSRLIEQAFAQAGTAPAKIAYLPDGVEFRVRFALTERLSKRGDAESCVDLQ